jgi:hypothetical protein
MCHPSCATCIDQSFTGCTSCTGSKLLFESSCYCSNPWNSDCTSGIEIDLKRGIFPRDFQAFPVNLHSQLHSPHHSLQSQNQTTNFLQSAQWPANDFVPHLQSGYLPGL